MARLRTFPPVRSAGVALSRRTFLAASAGFLLAPAACGSDQSDTAATGQTTGPTPDHTHGSIGGSTGDRVLVRFFPDGILAAGTRQRLPVGLGDRDGVLTTGGP